MTRLQQQLVRFLPLLAILIGLGALIVRRVAVGADLPALASDPQIQAQLADLVGELGLGDLLAGLGLAATVGAVARRRTRDIVATREVREVESDSGGITLRVADGAAVWQVALPPGAVVAVERFDPGWLIRVQHGPVFLLGSEEPR